MNPLIDFKDYDFLCAGSGVYGHKPNQQVVDIMFFKSHRPRRKGIKEFALHRKVVPGPKKGIIFVTYGGARLGPTEAEPALSLLELQIEHIRFKCIGKFACPGKMGEHPTPEYWHGDISHRPSERDLRHAEIFLEEKLEEVR